MTPRRTAAELRALAALLDNTRAVAGMGALVEVALSQEFAMRFAGACEVAADALDPLEEDEEEDELGDVGAQNCERADGGAQKGGGRMLRTMPNERRDLRTRIEHVLPLPPCCPVSANPLVGSTLTLRYRAEALVLEVYSLKQHIKQFVGGHADGTRNMETMIQHIAQDAADALGVPVFAHAHLLLHPEQQMRLSVTARPAREP